MSLFYLRRSYFPTATLSYLCDENQAPLCLMIERAWKNNQSGVSCVPEGEYDLLPHTSPKFGKCYALEAPSLGVTRYGPSIRTHILVHKANKASQLEGCLAPGRTLGVLDNETAVLSSSSAFDYLMKLWAGQKHKLIIKEA